MSETADAKRLDAQPGDDYAQWDAGQIMFINISFGFSAQ